MDPQGRSRGDGEFLSPLALLLLLLGQPVEPGPSQVVITGSPPLPSAVELGHSTALPTDSSLTRLREDILGWYLSMGYPFAEAGLFFSSEDSLMVNMVPGRHALLEEVRIEGSSGTRPSVFTRLLSLEPGEPYDGKLVEEWRGSLARLPFVESVGESRLLQGEFGDLVLVQQVTVGPSGYFSASMGWDGDVLRGGGDILFLNLAGTARELEISARTTDWGGLNAFLRYREPWIMGVPLSAELAVSQMTPESAWVNREGSVSIIWELDELEARIGAGMWRGYPPAGSDQRYDFGLAGLRFRPGSRVPQGWLGADLGIETRVGDRSGGDTTGVLSMGTVEFTGHWFNGAIGLGGDVLSGGILAGDWFTGLLPLLGGQSTLRGYPEDSFRAVRYGIARPEVSLGETATRIYTFSDLAVVETEDGMRYPVGCGAGIRGVSGVFIADAAVGFPISEGPGSSRVYLTVTAGI